MNDFVTSNWPLMVIAALVALVLLWWLLIYSRRTRIEVDRRDTLDEGASPAARNHALIDAPPAAAGTMPQPQVPDAMGAPGAAVAAVIEDDRSPAGAAGGDDLTRIKGLGPKLAATLQGLGITRYAQIAAWDDAEIDRIDAQLGRFQGRIRRDGWVAQARLLAAGNEAEFTSKFGAV